MTLAPRTGIVARGRRRRGGAGQGSEPSAAVVYATNPDRSGSVHLDAATPGSTGDIYVHLNVQSGISTAHWYLGADAAAVTTAANAANDASPTWVRNDATNPYDLKGGTTVANPLDLASLPTGDNTVACRVIPTVGSPYTVTATFTRSGGGVSNPSRIDHGTGRLLVALSTAGINHALLPHPRRNGNLDRDLPDRAAATVASFCADALAAGVGNVVLTVPLAWQKKSAKADPAGSLAKMQAVADGELDDVYNDIAQAYIDNGYPNGIIRLAHEHNLPAFAHYSGNGRAAVFKAAWERAASVIRGTAPNLVLDWNVGTEGADPDTGGTLTRVVDPAAFSETWPPDTIGLDAYCRSSGRTVASLTEDLETHAGYVDVGGFAEGLPLSYPEAGVTLAVPGLSSTPGPYGTDSQAADWIDTFFTFADSVDLAYVGWWNATKISQGYKYIVDRVDGRTQDLTVNGVTTTYTHSGNPLSWAALDDWF